MGNIFILLLITVIPIVISTSLPADRAVCTTKQVLIVDEVSVPVSMDFSSEEPDIVSIVQQECDAWRIVHSLSRRRRSMKSLSEFLNWLLSLFSKTGITVAKIGTSVMKHAPKVAVSIGKGTLKAGRFVAKRGMKIGVHAVGKVKYVLKKAKEVSDMFPDQPFSFNDLLETYFILYEHSLKMQEKAAEGADQTELTYDGFQRDVANILNKGTLGDFMKIAPDLIKDLNATTGYTIPNDQFFQLVKPRNVRCDSSTSISFDIDLFKSGMKLIEVQSCEDIGALNENGKYASYIFPSMTFSNYSGSYELNREFCKGDDKMLICVPLSLRRTDCSVQQINNCGVRILAHNELNKHRARLGASEFEVFEMPYSAVLKGLRIGKAVQIKGKTHKHGSWFGVDLIGIDGRIILHVNPRFDYRQVVFNTFDTNFWQNEESAESFPFHKNRDFDLTIRRELYHYKISVDGRHLASYAHRANPDLVSDIRIIGHIDLYKVIVI